MKIVSLINLLQIMHTVCLILSLLPGHIKIDGIFSDILPRLLYTLINFFFIFMLSMLYFGIYWVRLFFIFFCNILILYMNLNLCIVYRICLLTLLYPFSVNLKPIYNNDLSSMFRLYIPHLLRIKIYTYSSNYNV